MTNSVFPRKDAAATIYFSATAMLRLSEGGAYSRAALIRGRHLISLPLLTRNLITSSFIRHFLADTMTDHKYLFSSAVSCVQVYLVARHRKTAKARERRW